MSYTTAIKAWDDGSYFYIGTGISNVANDEIKIHFFGCNVKIKHIPLHFLVDELFFPVSCCHNRSQPFFYGLSEIQIPCYYIQRHC